MYPQPKQLPLALSAKLPLFFECPFIQNVFIVLSFLINACIGQRVLERDFVCSSQLNKCSNFFVASVGLHQKFDINEIVIPLHAMLFSFTDYKIYHLSMAFSMSQQAVGKASQLSFCLMFTKYLVGDFCLVFLFMFWSAVED